MNRNLRTSQLQPKSTDDSNGNTATKVDSTGTTTYAWDFENRLTSVTPPGSGGTVSFAYDPFGRRIKKVTSTITSVFAYDGDNLVEETNASGVVVARYEDTQNIDEPLAMLRSSATSYFHADGLGSITSLSNSAGSIANTYTYDSFGKLTASTGSLVNPFRYTARESDTETGLYYYRARYYDPAIGRFVTEDPIRFRAGIDYYSYVHNRPTALRDPRGRIAWGGGGYVSGMAGLLTIGGGAEGSCMIVGDTAGNVGLLCCAGLGGGYVAGAAASAGGTFAICPTCATICDMEGGSIQGEAFGATGPGAAAGGGVSVDMKNATIYANAGPAAGEGGGVVLLATSCKLVLGGKRCKNCPLSKK
jgi:RHS repeat-associated protein